MGSWCSAWSSPRLGLPINQEKNLPPAAARILSRGNGMKKQGSRKLERVGKIIRPHERIRAVAEGESFRVVTAYNNRAAENWRETR